MECVGAPDRTGASYPHKRSKGNEWGSGPDPTEQGQIALHPGSGSNNLVSKSSSDASRRTSSRPLMWERTAKRRRDALHAPLIQRVVGRRIVLTVGASPPVAALSVLPADGVPRGCRLAIAPRHITRPTN